MSRRYYANAAPQLSLATNANASVTTLAVSGSFAGWPGTYPFFAALEYGTSNMEIVSVTGVVGTTATVVRGQDGTTALSHSSGATLDQVVVAKDMDEANAHVNSTGAVHGLVGSIVGTTDAQTLSNKTLSAPTITAPAITGGAVIAGNLTVSGTITAAGGGGSSPAGFIGEVIAAPSTKVLVSAMSTIYIPAATVTFTLAGTRRIRIAGQCRLLFGGSTSLYALQPGYAPGATATAANAVPVGAIGYSGPAGSSNAQLTHVCQGTALLSAGTYTACLTISQLQGAFAVSDSADSFYVAVYDEGSI